MKTKFGSFPPWDTVARRGRSGRPGPDVDFVGRHLPCLGEEELSRLAGDGGDRIFVAYHDDRKVSLPSTDPMKRQPEEDLPRGTINWP